MVSPAWFFSTLAQVTAAILGLTTAFAFSVFDRRQAELSRRNDQFRGEINNIREKYQPVLDTISSELRDNADFDRPGVRFDLERLDEQEWAEEQTDSTAARIWANTSGISHLLADTDLLSATLDRDDLYHLNSAAQTLVELLGHGGEEEQLYKEITSSKNSPDSFYIDDIFEDRDRIAYWLNRHMSTSRANAVAMSPTGSGLTGKNIFSWVILLDELRSDGIELGTQAIRTDVGTNLEPGERLMSIIRVNIGLGIVGALIPSFLLISSPDLGPVFVDLIPQSLEWLIDWATALIQLILLLLTAFLTYRLFTIMQAVGLTARAQRAGDGLGSSSDDGGRLGPSSGSGGKPDREGEQTGGDSSPSADAE